MKQEEQNNTLPIGSMLREYEILSVLGQGGFGITYKARDTHLDAIMVIKEYMPTQFASRNNNSTVTCISNHKDTFEWGKQRFLDEAKVVKKFDHISIVKVLNLFEMNGTAYFVMDFYEGETLEDYLLRHPNKKFSQDEILSVMMPIIEGLKAVHAEGFLHRDIAPDNIFLRQTKPPILIDFGASRNALGVQSQNISTIVKHGYSPPEQYTSSSKQNETTDLYAISAVIYEMITGSKPPESTHRQTEVFVNGNPDLLEDIVNKYKDRFEPSFLKTITKGLSIRQNDRIVSIEDYQRGLVEDDRETQKIEPDSKVEKAPINIFFIVIIVLLLALIGGGVWYVLNEKDRLAQEKIEKIEADRIAKDKIRQEELTKLRKELELEKKRKEKIIEPTSKNITTIGNLMWQGDSNHKPIEKQWVTQANYDAENYMDTSGDTATSYCSNLSLGGYSDWRLPTIDELKKVVSSCGGIIDEYDKNKANKSYQECYKLKGFGSSYYWSSSTNKSSSNGAWIVNFRYGYVHNNSKSNNHYVRCVRAGE